MIGKILPWLVLVYVGFLTFIHVKISEFINNKRSVISTAPNSARRGDGWILTTLAMIPVPFIIPEYTKIYGSSYIIVSMIWGVIYFDFIAKNKESD